MSKSGSFFVIGGTGISMNRMNQLRPMYRITTISASDDSKTPSAWAEFFVLFGPDFGGKKVAFD